MALRIIYMGTPEFSIPGLQILLENNYPIVSVVTAPDKPRGRGQQILPSPVKEFAAKHQLPVLQPQHLKEDAFISSVAALKPDLIVVVAFRILPKDVFTIPRVGAFNLHASLLPRYRGAAPINWAIINGDKETGVTTFFLREKVDTGAVLLQARVKIGPDETAGELHDKLAAVGAEIILQTVRLIELGKAQPRVQDDGLATPAPKIFKDDCRIDWNKPRMQVHNFIRGMSPVPCAWTTHGEKGLKIFRTQMPSTSGSVAGQPGTVVHTDKDSLSVACADDAINVVEIQQEGRKKMGVEEFLRGHPLHAGEKLG